MLIQTSRFGSVQITKEDVLDFPEGLLGFAKLRDFVLLDDPTDEIFAWLQSCEDSEIAFPILEPELFTEGYKVELGRRELEALSAGENQKLRLFVIITIPDDPTKMTANLKAPIVINPKNRLARQCVLQDNHLAIREPIFTKLQQRVVQNPQIPLKSRSSEWEVAVRLPERQSSQQNRTLDT